jgi:hypothetical protein
MEVRGGNSSILPGRSAEKTPVYPDTYSFPAD